MAVFRDTTPQPRWGPTPIYGGCEDDECGGTARTSCATCSGEYCLEHAAHDVHARPAATG